MSSQSDDAPDAYEDERAEGRTAMRLRDALGALRCVDDWLTRYGISEDCEPRKIIADALAKGAA